jgi:hypothetical protein
VRTLLAVLAFALVTAAGASAKPAVTARVVDRTYSCSVRPERYVDVNASVALSAAVTGHPTPAQMWLDTVHKTKPIGGLQAVVPQVEFESAKSSLQVDTATCRRSSHRIALKSAGLPLYETVTPKLIGHVNERCATPKRALVRFRIVMDNGTPQQALFAVRRGDAKSRPLEFIKWSPRKITAYAGKSCTDTG